ncbi:MAG: IS6 family transposase, partial [Thermoprotei archaeon]
MNIFEYFKQLNIFKRNKIPFELKVLGILMYAFGLSTRKTAKLLTLTKQKISKTSIHNYVRKASQALKLKPEPKVHKIISVDETVIKLNGEKV